ncbi:SDR family NAD(P)-dependent oxidoreductase [Chitinophaga pinensis]|uniref:Short-chain dehydrogenase/reductase SDR n=1 Tax=Chitinophaga pinensis (strain ATCC 43595 / DSM 2588 / LMG 13176 / NBRC 15968 / NCIMB 11800 / UQM 2034) TaxID=485918 RepID=A0A979GPL2_CHIPD|nr:SDR family oxidoreductase [Chitinophaga pinensis]ACU60607.1 short-chain dehydrogenase/reductase SDR [Chitinophaga pinensis DSM 2588]
MQLQNKVAIVTGASKGIGAGIAKQMAAAGAKVVVNYVSSAESAAAVVAAITTAGGTAIAIQADTAKQEDIQRLFTQTIAAYGSLDVLVNNAGIYELAPLVHVTADSFNRIFNINVLGIILASQAAVQFFGAKGGSIINISSFASTRPEPYSLVYAASKGAVDSITISLAQELGPQHIRVNAVQPGGVLTEGVAKLGATADSEPIRQTIARSALGRMATPEDIGNTVVFLAADEASVITGQFIEVSGGFK